VTASPIFTALKTSLDKCGGKCASRPFDKSIPLASPRGLKRKRVTFDFSGFNESGSIQCIAKSPNSDRGVEKSLSRLAAVEVARQDPATVVGRVPEGPAEVHHRSA
jgi:hypothetical protein